METPLVDQQAVDPPQEEAQPPVEQVRTNVAEEPTLPADADLDELYDEGGQARYETTDAEGNVFACDADGNPIPAQRPQAASPSSSEPEPPAAVPARPAATPQTFRAPFADSLLSEQEREAMAGRYDEQDLAFLTTIAVRAADRIVQARDQQRIAARSANIPDEAIDAGRAYEHLVPQDIRGTPEGAMTAAGLAILNEARESKDFLGTLQRYARMGALDNEPAPARKPAPTPPLVPPSARTFTPNPSPETSRVVGRRASSGDRMNQLFHEDGLDSNVDYVAILRRERGGR